MGCFAFYSSTFLSSLFSFFESDYCDIFIFLNSVLFFLYSLYILQGTFHTVRFFSLCFFLLSFSFRIICNLIMALKEPRFKNILITLNIIAIEQFSTLVLYLLMQIITHYKLENTVQPYSVNTPAL